MGMKSAIKVISVLFAFFIALSFTSGHAQAQGGGIIAGCRKSNGGSMIVGESTPSGWTCQPDGSIVCRGKACASAGGSVGYGTSRFYGAIVRGNAAATPIPQQSYPAPAVPRALPTQPPPQPTAISWQSFTLVLQPGEELTADGLWFNDGRPVIPPIDPCATPVNMVSRMNGEIYNWDCGSQNWVWGAVTNGSYWQYELQAEPTPQGGAVAPGSGANPPSRSTSQNRTSDRSRNPTILIIGILLFIGSLGFLARRVLKKQGGKGVSDPEFDEGSLPGMPEGFIPAPISQEER